MIEGQEGQRGVDRWMNGEMRVRGRGWGRGAGCGKVRGGRRQVHLCDGDICCLSQLAAISLLGVSIGGGRGCVVG